MNSSHLLELSLLRAFVLVVEEKGVTRAARRLNRTQPAVSSQLQKLEQVAGRKLFETSRRRLMLTRDGELLLPYARRLLSLHDEARATLASDEMAGRVILGCPDLYAAFLLPRTLARFQSVYPAVEVTVRCALSRQLADEMERGDLDVALATRMPDVHPKISTIRALKRERLIWLGSQNGTAHRRDPIPIGMLPPGNLYRDYAQAALDRAGRPWRIACTSESIAGLQAMAAADAAVIVLAEAARMKDLQELGPSEGMPALPPVELVLWQRRPGLSPAADELARFIELDIGAEPAPPALSEGARDREHAT